MLLLLLPEGWMPCWSGAAAETGRTTRTTVTPWARRPFVPDPVDSRGAANLAASRASVPNHPRGRQRTHARVVPAKAASPRSFGRPSPFESLSQPGAWRSANACADGIRQKEGGGFEGPLSTMATETMETDGDGRQLDCSTLPAGLWQTNETSQLVVFHWRSPTPELQEDPRL